MRWERVSFEIRFFNGFYASTMRRGIAEEEKKKIQHFLGWKKKKKTPYLDIHLHVRLSVTVLEHPQFSQIEALQFQQYSNRSNH